jgi:hypothetical protein
MWPPLTAAFWTSRSPIGLRDDQVNNAGIMAVPQRKTVDGFDKFGYRLAAQKKVEYGALPTLYAATQGVPGNSYIWSGGRSGELPKIEKRSKSNNDSQMARQLWDLSSRLTHAGSTLPSRVLNRSAASNARTRSAR